MLRITLITVGKLKEKYFIEASREYEKRLSTYCKLTVKELEQAVLPSSPTPSEIKIGLRKEAENIEKAIPNRAVIIPLCIEGKLLDSEELSRKIDSIALSGEGDICFIIGGSYGISDSIKQKAALKLSMSPMTFPHRLARIMLLEQLYRAFKIREGSAYHK